MLGVKRINGSRECYRTSRITQWPGRTHMISENRMTVRHALIPLALTLLAVGCAGSHPTAVQQPPAQGPHFLRWAGNSPPQFRAIDPLSGSGAGGGGGSHLGPAGRGSVLHPGPGGVAPACPRRGSVRARGGKRPSTLLSP